MTFAPIKQKCQAVVFEKNLFSVSKLKIFNDPVHGFISLPKGIMLELVDHPYFQRLRRIKQLGLTHLVYPGALHTRFHHTLGAVHLMQNALQSLRSKSFEISDKDYQSACLAILLHDIGHGPFSHGLEHVLISDANHEDIGSLIIQNLNEDFQGNLNGAMEIVKANRKDAPFFHELLSSQLDVDRLDYLARDSFYTGVSEGIIGLERIIKMMSLSDDHHLIIEDKGIYSVEKFIIARRLMYWQVYLHKTVICAEKMLSKTIERAREIGEKACLPFKTPLNIFISNEITWNDLKGNPKILEGYLNLDDHDIMFALKTWCNHDDLILRILSRSILERRLFKIQLMNNPANEEDKSNLKSNIKELLSLDSEQLKYFVFSDSVSNAAYSPLGASQIRIKVKNSGIMDMAEAANVFQLSNLQSTVERYYLCYPKDMADIKKFSE